MSDLTSFNFLPHLHSIDALPTTKNHRKEIKKVIYAQLYISAVFPPQLVSPILIFEWMPLEHLHDDPNVNMVDQNVNGAQDCRIVDLRRHLILI